MTCEEKSLHDLSKESPALDGDILLLGYWVDQAGPCKPMRGLMEQIEGKHVGIFCTMAYWCDASHGTASLHSGAECVKARNTVIGGIACNGHMSQKMIDMFRSMKAGAHSSNPASEARWALMKEHPSECEIALAAERFNERIALLHTLQAQGLAFPPVEI